MDSDFVIQKKIYIRCELNESEYRTPIVPNDIQSLLKEGFTVYIQSSNHRIYSDKDYIKCGAIITKKQWHDSIFNDALIIGLKELSHIDLLSKHTHMYFSHSYKNQSGSLDLLSAFSTTSSTIYDFEFFLDKNNKRIISFGYYAGVAGCFLALLQFIKKSIFGKSIIKLTPWENKDEIIHYISRYSYLFHDIKVAIIGANGNCGTGVKDILDILNITYTIIGKNSDKSNLMKYDILYNCIVLDKDEKEIWFTKKNIFYKSIIISDISCDYSKSNNPIQLYDRETTWETPVYSYNQFVDIIAINNLPSLLPKESSSHFSSKCVDILLNKSLNYSWIHNKQIFDNIRTKI